MHVRLIDDIAKVDFETAPTINSAPTLRKLELQTLPRTLRPVSEPEYIFGILHIYVICRLVQFSHRRTSNDSELIPNVPYLFGGRGMANTRGHKDGFPFTLRDGAWNTNDENLYRLSNATLTTFGRRK